MPDEQGAALLSVVVVMFVGLAAAVLIASSVVLAMWSNGNNRSNTQAFVAAESGRDAAVAQLNAAIAANGTFSCNAATLVGSNPADTNPDYTFTVYSTDGAKPTVHDGLESVCPTKDSKYIVINAIGTDAAGGRAEIDAVYPWIVQPEQQAGGVLAYFAGNVTSTVSNYTGDLVVRSGNYSCVNEGTINGDLYVTHGSVSLSKDCTVNGNIWARDNVDASSQLIRVTGEVRAGGDITFVSNGSQLGATPPPASPAPNGDVLAGGKIELKDAGSSGRVYGNLFAHGTISVGTKWVVAGTQTPDAPVPVFNPTLDFIKSVTSWIDLDEASGWNVPSPISACSLTSAQIIALMSDGGTTPIAFSYQGCAEVTTDITLSGPASVAITKDVLFLAPAGKRMNLHIDTGLTGGKQIVFLHADASRDLDSGETSPSCGNGNTKDTFDLDAGRNVTSVKIMVYSPCGLTGNIHASFTGQLYSNDSGTLSFGNGASYTCALMAWPDAFKKLGCKIRGTGEDVVIETVLTQRPGTREHQTER